MSLIVIEGPDGAGKSTLLEKLAEDFNYPIYRSGGPKDAFTMRDVLKTMGALAFDEKQVYLCDRAPWFSEQVYSRALGREMVLPEEIFLHCFNLPQRVIYCTLADSETMLSNMSREFKAHKPAEHTAGVVANHEKICRIYDEIIDEAESVGLDVFGYDWQNGSYDELTKWIGE